MKKLLLSLMLTLFLFVNIILGQSGYIRNSVTDEVIVDALIMVKGTSITTHSDQSGYYFIVVPEDKNTLLIIANGMQTKELAIVEYEKEDELFDIYLDPKAEGVIYNMTIEELMHIEVNVASGSKTLTQRESPGIISVLTEDEILNSGARDLIDVLRLIPGISFGFDVYGTVGITMRGNWGHEGKVLLMIDGQEMNDLLYTCTFFGNHYSPEQIKRIEIIRGSGSSIYGGFAELGVINVITRTGEDMNGLKFGGEFGYLTETYARENINLEIGKKIKDFEFSVSGYIGKGNRSDDNYTDMYQNTYNMSGQSELTSTLINTNIKFKTFSARFIYDKYDMTQRDWLGESLSQAYDNNFKTLSGELKGDIIFGKNFIVTPKFTMVLNEPWKSMEDSVPVEDQDYYYNYFQRALRLKGNLTASYNVSEKMSLILGGEYFYDQSEILDNENLYWNGESEVSLSNISGFMQAIYKTKFANITLGARVDNHNIFGTAFAPRLAVTKIMNNFHLKVLVSQAFRSPGIDNINLSSSFSDEGLPTIKPEKSQTAELEIGYKIGSNMSLTANAFYINIDQPIVFFVDSLNREGYFNKDKTGTTGLDFEYRWRGKKSSAALNYSYYSAKGINRTEDYAVPGNEHFLLATPQHTVNLYGSINLFKDFSVNPTIILYGKRYGYTSYDSNEEAVLNEFKPIVLTNIFLNYRNFLTKGLDFGIGVFDVFDSDLAFIQPYNGGHAPLPTGGREIVGKLSYKLNFK